MVDPMNSNVLLFSGGIDSFCAFRYLASELKISFDMLYFDLATPYTPKELKYVTRHPKLRVDESLRFLGKTQVGEKAFVPYRNVFLAMRAASFGYTKIWIAGVQDDQVNDKSEIAFLDFSAFLSRYSTDGKAVQILSPFWHLTKAEVVEMMLEKNLVSREELAATVSCYSPGETRYCGRCNCCFRKFIALRANGIGLDFYDQKMMREYYSACKNGRYDEKRARITIEILEEYAKEPGKEFGLTGTESWKRNEDSGTKKD